MMNDERYALNATALRAAWDARHHVSKK